MVASFIKNLSIGEFEKEAFTFFTQKNKISFLLFSFKGGLIDLSTFLVFSESILWVLSLENQTTIIFRRVLMKRMYMVNGLFFPL